MAIPCLIYNIVSPHIVLTHVCISIFAAIVFYTEDVQKNQNINRFLKKDKM